jgi:hypothetical protein
VIGLRAIDTLAMSRLAAAPAHGSGQSVAERDQPLPSDQQPADLDPTPMLPPGSDVPEELVGLSVNGALYVPLRAALRLVGGEPPNGAQGGRVQTISGVGLVEFDIGSTHCVVNGRAVALRAPAIVQAGTAYITARDFAELFEAPVAVSEDGRRATFAVHGRQVTARPESDFYEVEIDRTARRLTLRFREREVQSFPVCVGRGRSTPLGQFRIANKVVWPAWRSIYTGALVPGGPGNPLGARWLGLTACGSGGHVIGVHGTNAPRSIGRAMSAGCIRMHNKDVVALCEKVVVGTPVRIHD